MPIKIIRKRERVEEVEYLRSFTYNGTESGAGFSFDCNEAGEVDVKSLNDAALANYIDCICGVKDVTDEGVQCRRWTWTNPAVGLCSCGREVQLDGFTNTCECGRDYNSCGDLLGPRSQWGEETGEYLSDILRIP